MVSNNIFKVLGTAENPELLGSVVIHFRTVNKGEMEQFSLS